MRKHDILGWIPNSTWRQEQWVISMQKLCKGDICVNYNGIDVIDGLWCAWFEIVAQKDTHSMNTQTNRIIRSQKHILKGRLSSSNINRDTWEIENIIKVGTKIRKKIMFLGMSNIKLCEYFLFRNKDLSHCTKIPPVRN